MTEPLGAHYRARVETWVGTSSSPVVHKGMLQVVLGQPAPGAVTDHQRLLIQKCAELIERDSASRFDDVQAWARAILGGHDVRFHNKWAAGLVYEYFSPFAACLVVFSAQQSPPNDATLWTAVNTVGRGPDAWEDNTSTRAVAKLLWPGFDVLGDPVPPVPPPRGSTLAAAAAPAERELTVNSRPASPLAMIDEQRFAANYNLPTSDVEEWLGTRSAPTLHKGMLEAVLRGTTPAGVTGSQRLLILKCAELVERDNSRRLDEIRGWAYAILGGQDVEMHNKWIAARIYDLFRPFAACLVACAARHVLLNEEAVRAAMKTAAPCPPEHPDDTGGSPVPPTPVGAPVTRPADSDPRSAPKVKAGKKEAKNKTSDRILNFGMTLREALAHHRAKGYAADTCHFCGNAGHRAKQCTVGPS